ncbi:MAG: quinolinate synthase NadA [Prolixibacteraceae bacterium]|jgi:quinolinate synthase|nr:quinolinate synthase NadA [Prolixibacteraceae bacterium]MDD4755866.1 quinolinate synthase NadA [Prolixibacteraceae bacterium]
MGTNKELAESVNRLKKQRNAVILAHVYQQGEVQDIADYVGDSLDLSRKAVQTNADVIVFCGVQFMAETAAILNPHKTVLLPDKNAGCGLADMATAQQVSAIKKQDPELKVVSYVNSSAELKAVSDICCTSANAVKVVNSLNSTKVLFVPDRNLGSHVAENSDKIIQLWDGYCYVHEQITLNDLITLHDEHPDAAIIVHPECTAPVRHLADFTGSTSQMSRYVKESKQKEFIVGTEINFVYRLKADNSGKLFYPVNTLCEGMNLISLEKIKWSLENMEYKVMVPDKIRAGAKIALDKMLEVK